MKTSTSDIPELEKHNFLIQVARLFTVPILNSLPALLIKTMMRKSSHDAATVVARGGSTHALEAMYTRYHRGIFSRGFLQGIADLFWHHFVSQPKALRNRLHIVQFLLEKEILAHATPILILSIAGGSARSLINTVAKLRAKHFPHTVRAVIVDKDETALEVGKRIAVSAGVGDCFQWVHGNAHDTAVLLPNIQFDVVEIVGLLDYFSDERLIRLLSVLRKTLVVHGSLIAANVIPNSEIPFVHKTGWPHMYYRTTADFARVVETAEFSVRDTIMEPLGVHAVVLARAS